MMFFVSIYLVLGNIFKLYTDANYDYNKYWFVPVNKSVFYQVRAKQLNDNLIMDTARKSDVIFTGAHVQRRTRTPQ